MELVCFQSLTPVLNLEEDEQNIYRIVAGDMSGSGMKIFFWLRGKVARIRGNYLSFIKYW